MSSRSGSSSKCIDPHRPQDHTVQMVTQRFRSPRPSRLDIQFVDFDNTRFHISTPQSKTQLVLSMGIQCWSDLVKYGAEDTLKKEYGEWVVATEQEGKEQEYDVTLIVDLEKIPEDEGAILY